MWSMLILLVLLRHVNTLIALNYSYCGFLQHFFPCLLQFAKHVLVSDCITSVSEAYTYTCNFHIFHC